MFSQESVCPQGGVHGGERVHDMGACMVGGGWRVGCVAGETATAVRGTHPTEMHSYYRPQMKFGAR